jgi:hypothetical protein
MILVFHFLQNYEEPLMKLPNANALHIHDIFKNIHPIFLTHQKLSLELDNVLRSVAASAWPLEFANILKRMVGSFTLLATSQL